MVENAALHDQVEGDRFGADASCQKRYEKPIRLEGAVERAALGTSGLLSSTSTCVVGLARTATETSLAHALP